MKTIPINLYEFSELQQDAKDKAIYEHRNFLENEPVSVENETGEMEYEYFEYSNEEVIESIEINEYLFFKNGELAYVVNYVGSHPDSGKIEFNLHGETYLINN